MIFKRSNISERVQIILNTLGVRTADDSIGIEIFALYFHLLDLFGILGLIYSSFFQNSRERLIKKKRLVARASLAFESNRNVATVEGGSRIFSFAEQMHAIMENLYSFLGHDEDIEFKCHYGKLLFPPAPPVFDGRPVDRSAPYRLKSNCPRNVNRVSFSSFSPREVDIFSWI